MNNAAVSTGFDAHLHVRCTADLLPDIHAVARRRGLTAASWVRATILDALHRNAPAANTEATAKAA